MAYKIYVDGQEGTTGLMIRERLLARNASAGDLDILEIDPDKRKDASERKKYINAADVVFLCLPDDAAREAVSMTENARTRLIDASTAHRTAAGWAYGIPELSAKHRDDIRQANRVSVPGCFASGFNILIYPLVARGLIPADHPLYCHSVTGYSGGGKKLIARYEDKSRDKALDSPCFYKLSLNHKHLPEMQTVSGLSRPPLFTPIVADFYSGMTVAVPLYLRAGLDLSVSVLCDFYADYYKGQPFIKVTPDGGQNLYDGDYLCATGCNGTNSMELSVCGNDEQAVLFACFDNLGKGSSGAAVQCMNIMTGSDERLGLPL